MRRAFLPMLCVALALCLPGRSGWAQEKTRRAEEQGWSSSWTTPTTDEQRRSQQFMDRCEALGKAKSFRAVVVLCDEELRKQPDFFLAYVYRAAALSGLKNYDRALADINHAKELAARKDRPTILYGVLIFRAEVNTRRRDYPAATEDLRAAVKLDHANPRALNELAWILATAPEGASRNGREAVALAKRALATTPGTPSYALTDTLAAAYAETRDYPRAAVAEKQALEQVRRQIKDAATLAKIQGEMTDRLHRFEQHRPYHAAP